MNNSFNPVEVKPDNSVAAIWSMMLPGLGQLLKNQVMPGILWAVFTGSGYFTYFWPGLIIHIFCVLDAAFNKGHHSWIGLSNWKQRIGFAILLIFLVTYVVIRNF